MYQDIDSGCFRCKPTFVFNISRLPSFMMSLRERLVDGYIRQNEKIIAPKIIPSSINFVVFRFYKNGSIICLIKQQFSNSKHEMFALDLESHQNWKFNVYDLENATKTIKPTTIAYTSTAYAKSWRIPHYINDKLESLQSNAAGFQYSSLGEYGVIFKCGGYNHASSYTSESSAILINEMQLNHHNQGTLFSLYNSNIKVIIFSFNRDRCNILEVAGISKSCIWDSLSIFS